MAPAWTAAGPSWSPFAPAFDVPGAALRRVSLCKDSHCSWVRGISSAPNLQLNTGIGPRQAYMTTPLSSERDRMLRGEAYNSRDPELLALAHRARALLARFAATPSTDGVARHEILSDLLGGVGPGVWIEPPFFCDYGAHVHLGSGTFVNVNCVFLDSAEIRVGANVLIGPGVQLLTVSHPLRAGDRVVSPDPRSEGAPYRTYARPISIGDRVWLGAGAVVLPGVTIGADTTIGAGSLVTRDVPPNTLAFGNPCRVRREL